MIKLLDSFEQSILGMIVGEKKTVSLEPNRSVGERLSELVVTLPRESVPEQHDHVKVGSKVHTKDDNGNPVIGKVTQLTGDMITVDTNHPLAGKTLVFDIEFIEFV